MPKLIAFESSFGFQPENASKFPLPQVANASWAELNARSLG